MPDRRDATKASNAFAAKSPVGMSSHATIGQSTFLQANSPSRSPATLPQYLDETMASLSSRSSAAPPSDASSLDESEWLEGPANWTDNLMDYVKGGKSGSEEKAAALPSPPVTSRPTSPSPAPSVATPVAQPTQSMQPQVEEYSTPKPAHGTAPATLQPVLVEQTPQPSLPIPHTSSLPCQSSAASPPALPQLDAEKEVLRARLAALETALAEKDHQLAVKDATISTLRTSAEATEAAHQQRLQSLRTRLDEEGERSQKIEKEKEKRESVWKARVEGLLKEVERRGNACLMLWGKLEHPGEVDGRGGQKYTYRSGGREAGR